MGSRDSGHNMALNNTGTGIVDFLHIRTNY